MLIASAGIFNGFSKQNNFYSCVYILVFCLMVIRWTDNFNLTPSLISLETAHDAINLLHKVAPVNIYDCLFNQSDKGLVQGLGKPERVQTNQRSPDITYNAVSPDHVYNLVVVVSSRTACISVKL